MKFITAVCFLFVGAVKGCTETEENNRKGDFRRAFANNIATLKTLAGARAGLLDFVKNSVTCAQFKSFVPTICSVDPSTHGLVDLETYCCYTCRGTTSAATTTAQLNPPRNAAPTNVAPTNKNGIQCAVLLLLLLLLFQAYNVLPIDNTRYMPM